MGGRPFTPADAPDHGPLTSLSLLVRPRGGNKMHVAASFLFAASAGVVLLLGSVL